MLKKTLPLFAGNLTQLGLQALQFFLLARILGADTFGMVAAATSLVTIGVPLSDAGLGHILQRHGARTSSSVGRLFGNALIANILVGCCMVGISTLFAHLIYDGKVPLLLVASISISEYLLFRMVWIAGQAQSADEKFGATAFYMVLTALCRVCGVLVLLIADSKNPLTWSIAVSAFAVILATSVLFSIQKTIGKWHLTLIGIASNWKEGITFSASDLSRSIGTDLDKVLLGRFASTGMLGPYTAAFRLVTFANAPVRAIVLTNRTNIYKNGFDGVTGLKPFILKTLQLGVPYTVLAGAALYILAPITPLILGSTFAPAVEILRSFALLPLIQLISLTAGDVLAGIGAVHQRFFVQIISNLSLLVFGFLLIRGGTWQGAVATCYIAETLLAILSCALILKAAKSQECAA